MANRRQHNALLLVILCGILWLAPRANGDSAELLFLDTSAHNDSERWPTEIAARFYGLQHRTVIVGNATSEDEVIRAIESRDAVAVVVTVDALSVLHARRVFSALQHRRLGPLPFLVIVPMQRTREGVLALWSGGAITGCDEGVESGKREILINAVPDVTNQLRGQVLDAPQHRVCNFSAVSNGNSESIVEIRSGVHQAPAFVRTRIGRQEVFFDSLSAGVVERDPSAVDLATFLPSLMFVRYAAGDRAWHVSAHFANLTIDDPWLREPYGHLAYSNLLREMQRHNFHTTIAFIPWNFDRSEAAVTALFRDHADRFSVCVHGNNHDHKEFDSYSARQLPEQVANIKQAMARMNRFTALTGVPYDRVMVFPHSIAPIETLSALKHYNFVATFNAGNVPIDAAVPADPQFALRTTWLAFGNFASIRRYSAELPPTDAELALNAFLGNPTLLYGHQELFAGGIRAFDSLADRVNRIEPATQWVSLGSVAENLYLLRRRRDGNYDVRMETSTARVSNVHNHDATFFVEKDEDFRFPLQVLVDGQKVEFLRSGQQLLLKLDIHAGRSRIVEIRYDNDFDGNRVDTTKDSYRVALLRYLSDFRDNTVSRFQAGRKFIAWNANGRHNFLLQGSAVLIIVIIGILAVLRQRRKQRLLAPLREGGYVPNPSGK